MWTSSDLRNLLERIDRRGYPAYKETKGEYRFPGYVLSIDHVQGDPFAAPSRLSIRVGGRAASFPPALYQSRRMHCSAGSDGRRNRFPIRPEAPGTAD